MNDHATLQANIIQFIETEIRPAINLDGGDLSFVELTHDNHVIIMFKAACVTCPFASYTLKQGVERRIKERFPQIRKVKAVL
jgi:Fe-S cluster biogenesis protein NfuA